VADIFINNSNKIKCYVVRREIDIVYCENINDGIDNLLESNNKI